MLAQYVSAALCNARYERLPYGWMGYIPEFDNLWVLEETRVKCEEELGVALENWLVFSHESGLPIPIIGGIDLAAVWDAQGRPTLVSEG